MSDDAVRDDLTELLRRRSLTQDAGRPDAVARRHAAGAPHDRPAPRARFIDTR